MPRPFFFEQHFYTNSYAAIRGKKNKKTVRSLIVVVMLSFKLREIYLEGKYHDSNGSSEHDSSRRPAVGLPGGAGSAYIVPPAVQTLNLKE